MNRDLDLSLGPEWAVLEALCLSSPDAEERGAIDELLLAPELDWDELLGQSLRHQVLCLLAHYVLSTPVCEGVPFYLVHHLATSLDLNRQQMRLYRSEAARIAAALTAEGIDFVATKGISFEATIYGGDGERMLKDIDFMIPPSQRDRVSALLRELGFVPGTFDRRSSSIVPHERRDQMRYILQPDHLPRFVRRLDDPCVPYIYVDIANSLTWNGSPHDLPVEEAIADRSMRPLPGLDGETLPCFNPSYELLFTALHLFREAWLDNWVELGIDVSLMKFGDVARLVAGLRRSPAAARFPDLLEQHSIVEPVAWVFEHLDRTFGTDSLQALGLEARVEGDWLNAAHPARGRPRRWTGQMRQRLHSRHRHALFVEETD